MTSLKLQQPLVFQPILQERIWGGRKLETLYRKQLPAGACIGESWELVDRAEAQSVVACGPLEGITLHELWTGHRREIFGDLADAERFPLLIKILDARETLSLQVHPPPTIAQELGGQSKTEFWYFTQTDSEAEIFVGLKQGSSREEIQNALDEGTVEDNLHRLPVKTGDAMFLPSGRMHAIGAGNVIIEIQENSDTTYRVFDWNRVDAQGSPRQLHIQESMRSIDFNDYEPKLTKPSDESLVRHPLFAVDKWNLDGSRSAGPAGEFAIVACLEGQIECAGISLRPGEFFLVPACLQQRALKSGAENSRLLRVTIP